MGNGIGKITSCFSGDQNSRRRCRRHEITIVLSQPLDEGLGHSFCYVRRDQTHLPSSKVHHSDDQPPPLAAVAGNAFFSISGASICANTSTPLSTTLLDTYCDPAAIPSSATFESSDSFAAVPLQPVPRLSTGNQDGCQCSGPIERGFLSGPVERGFLSGPLDQGSDQLKRSFSFSLGGRTSRRRSKKDSLILSLRKAIVRAAGQNSVVTPVKVGVPVKDLLSVDAWEKNRESLNINLTASSSANVSSDLSMEDGFSMDGQNLQWAQGKAGEDRVHVVVSEEHDWVYVGIYDGFNGPDAPDFLLSNLYSAVHRELKGLLWEDKFESNSTASDSEIADSASNLSAIDTTADSTGSLPSDQDLDSKSKTGRCKNSRRRSKGAGRKWEENQKRWRCEWERERLELERRLKEQKQEQLRRSCSDQAVNHSDVLKALSRALKKTEDSYLEVADKLLDENPELALMGSCVLVMLMKGEDVYLMNVGDSRVIIAGKAEPDIWLSIGNEYQELERINEETLHDLEASDADQSPDAMPSLTALQLTVDHSTSVEEEVQRIKKEHPDDAGAVVNDRVKGSLKVTRAFGAGFLKQPKWNDALIEMFRIDYVGTAPYITCMPSLFHHRLSVRDRFLILSSDGLYQYLTNEEAVAEVELFLASFPEGDPAQHLVEEVLFRAAKKAGMDFHELLEIPQGDRRRYHDDVSIIVISLEGRIWRSCM